MRAARTILIALLAGAALAEESSEAMLYHAYWAGTRVGEMILEAGTNPEEGSSFKSLKVGTSSWAKIFNDVSMTMRSETFDTPDGPCSRFSKQIEEDSFSQDDTMRLWPLAGKATVENARTGVVTESTVPTGSVDIASFFYDLRECPLLAGLETNAASRTVVMDGRTHGIVISTGEVVKVDSPWGTVDARKFFVVSQSETLFRRNVPKCVMIATDMPVIVEMDVSRRTGNVRFKLVEWTTNSVPVLPPCDAVAGGRIMEHEKGKAPGKKPAAFRRRFGPGR